MSGQYTIIIIIAIQFMHRKCSIMAICNRYRMVYVGSVLWIIKPTTPRAQPEGEGLYNP